MRSTRKIFAGVLVFLLAATIYIVLRTNGPTTASTATAVARKSSESLVDQTPLVRAQQLAQLPTSAEELASAQEALRLADYEVDLAFDAGLHEAKEHPPAYSGALKEIADRLQKAQKLVDEQQARVRQLAETAGRATGAKRDALQDDLAIAQEDLNLAQDEVDDAKQDLIRAGGDPEDRIQEMQKAHKDTEGNGSLVARISAQPDKAGLIYMLQHWSALHGKQLWLWSAKSRAEADAAALSTQHDALDAQVEKEKLNSPLLAHHAKKAAPSTANDPLALTNAGLTHEESAALLAQTKRISAGQRALALLDKRIETNKELASLYSQWIAIVAAAQRTELHRAAIGLTVILGLVLILLFFDGWLEKLLGRTSLDRRQVESLRTVTRVSLQVAAVVLVLLVIFGPPSQLGTFLGLAGAGLTVALKDFIVGFLGWFVLMGKNGIRLGDWVEINGVTGEVVELGMFHTVLLETGNWTDSGHPTGRRVTFTNSFAIEGHYFNFSTSGQWLWDELQVVVPTGQDPYPVADAIHETVADATAESAALAEREWKGASRSRDLSGLTAAPAINIKPVIGGVEIAVRYITRASERHQLRAKLYQTAVALLGQKPSERGTEKASVRA